MPDSSTQNLTLDDLIVSDPQIMAGRRVFRGTRVPIEVVFENLADGMSLEAILDEYDTLCREDVVRLIELASEALAQPRAA